MGFYIVRRWRKSDGDEVQAGEPLLDVEWDGLPSAVRAEHAGVLSICAAAGKRVSAGEVIATIEPIDGEAMYNVIAPEVRAGPIGRVSSGLKRLFGRS